MCSGTISRKRTHRRCTDQCGHVPRCSKAVAVCVSVCRCHQPHTTTASLDRTPVLVSQFHSCHLLSQQCLLVYQTAQYHVCWTAVSKGIAIAHGRTEAEPTRTPSDLGTVTACFGHMLQVMQSLESGTQTTSVVTTICQF